MARKLKCWRKISKLPEWLKRSNGESVGVQQSSSRTPSGRKKFVFTVFKESENKHKSLEKFGGIEAKPRAIRFANSYMRKHDKC